MHHSMPSKSLRSRVLESAASAPSMTRRQGRLLAIALSAASIALAMIVFESIGGLAHSAGRAHALTLLIATGSIALSGVLTWAVLSRGRSSMARAPLALGLAALATPLVVFLWMQLFSGTYAEPFQRVGYRCLSYCLVMSALPMASFMVLKRGVEPRMPAVLGAAVGAACSAWGGSLIDLWCPLTNAPHVLVGHVAPIVIAILIGALVGHFTLGIRAIPKRP
jgi:hypothetical protein